MRITPRISEVTDPERNSEIRPGQHQGPSCQPHRFPRARSCLFWFPWPEAGLDQRHKRAGCAVASEAGPIASAPPPASWYSLLDPHSAAWGERRACPSRKQGCPWIWVRWCWEPCSHCLACPRRFPILPMINKTISLSSGSRDCNTMCPGQLLNILNVSLTRTNPVEFFSNFPIR